MTKRYLCLAIVLVFIGCESADVKGSDAADAEVNARDENGFTQLHLAAYSGDTRSAASLIEKGADVNALDAKSSTPLEYAAQEGHEGIVKLLLAAKANVNASRKGEPTALDLALVQGHNEIGKLLIEAGANINSTDSRGFSPIINAARHGEPEILELLIKRKANVNARTAEGATPLMGAVLGKRIVNVKLLIKARADINIKDNDGETALMKVRDCDQAMIAILKAAKAKGSPKKCSNPTIAESSYSAYNLLASRQKGQCVPAKNFNGHNVSPDILLSKYPCEIKGENESLGGLFLFCRGSPISAGNGYFLFVKNPRDCNTALEALRQM